MKTERLEIAIERAIWGVAVKAEFERSYLVSLCSIIRREFALGNISFEEEMNAVNSNILDTHIQLKKIS